ncbi:MAG TPA: vanadium-dependent haloperoxidase, partial [Usitatibacter sp.]|nr:vanadium-dependent haloperoxidase [Usitatibacter sp.]
PAGADEYRPSAHAGVYVPTANPAVPMWGKRKPWLMGNAAQFRPAAPPALASAAWQRDYDEVKSLGARNSVARSPEQAEIARFWEYSLPSIYFAASCSMAGKPGRDAVSNARMLAAAAQAMDDSLIAVFEAKYHYNFWRPTTAIRNGDLDGNAATERQGDWTPLIDVPMHPEYPSGHSILAASVGAVLAAEFGGMEAGPLAASSPSAKGAVRKWNTIADFVNEVSAARVYAGIHFRTATTVGAEMGAKIGTLAARETKASLASVAAAR